MVSQLTLAERQRAMVMLLAVAVLGLVMAAAGRGDPFGTHGLLVSGVSIALVFVIIAGYFAPEPSEDRLWSYYDDPSKAGIVLAMVWAVFALIYWRLGRLAARLSRPHLRRGWSSFGRLRPVHTTGVIFGFGGNALIATSFYVLQRTSRARLPDQLSPWFVLIGYNLFCVIAVTGYMMGITQSKEYAEPEWYADIWLVVVWVTYFIIYLAHAGAAQGAAHLRRQLVLHGVHPGRGDAAHRQ